MEASGVGCVVPKTMAARVWGLFGVHGEARVGVQWWLGFGRKRLMGQFEKSGSGGGRYGAGGAGRGLGGGRGGGSAGAVRCEPNVPTRPRRPGREGALSSSPSHRRSPGRAEPHRAPLPRTERRTGPGPRLPQPLQGWPRHGWQRWPPAGCPSCTGLAGGGETPRAGRAGEGGTGGDGAAVTEWGAGGEGERGDSGGGL